jgi:ketosteroid isomerase-like protein
MQRESTKVTRDLQYVLDYIAIRDLSAEYNRCADTADGERHAQLYTEDGEFEIAGDRVYRGREQLAAITNATTILAHTTTDPVIVLDGDTARQTSRLILTSKPQDGGANEFIATGRYIDELKRTPDGWRFHRRRIESDASPEEIRRKMGITEAFDEVAHSPSG